MVKSLFSALLLVVALPGYGQSEAEAATPGFADSASEARGALGTFLGTIHYPDPPVEPGDLPAGLDEFDGHLLVTELGDDPAFFVMDTSGTLVRPAVPTSPITTGPLGVADSPEGVWLTDLGDARVALNTFDASSYAASRRCPRPAPPKGWTFTL
ncbi:MAG: hypothetical protein AAGC60_14175 [Acidobacteriota bacterium]